ncbi:MAG: 1-deoxy-D-xylulose-5-phosphate synthase [Planctomycetota bacterium]
MDFPLRTPSPPLLSDSSIASPESQETEHRQIGKILAQVSSPPDLRRLSLAELRELAEDIRAEIIKTVHVNGGHLGAPLGVVELTIALHYVFDFREDRLIFDVGHQCYPHKLLTGRKALFPTLRTFGGLSGFPSKHESEYDPMTSGHAGTSLSMGLGLARGFELLGENKRVVCVIGDASLGAGIAFEALNDAGQFKRNMLVILNDNAMSISRTVGALSRYLSKIRTAPLYTNAKREIQHLISSIPIIGGRVERGIEQLLETLKNIAVPGHVFEELGYHYYGPHDGHDLSFLINTLNDLKDVQGLKMLHLITRKGQGLEEARTDPTALHGVSAGARFPESSPVGLQDLDEGQRCVVEKLQAEGKTASFCTAFEQVIEELGAEDERIVTITAAMPDGTGLAGYARTFPKRFFDVGITEQHAVAMASGLSLAGLKPVVCIYTTFLQRAFDQVFQEVALQGNPVVFVQSHGGLAGEDGATHHGLFDIPFLRALPGVVLLSPRDGAELKAMLRFAIKAGGPVFIRYPKASCVTLERAVAPLELGRPEVLRTGPDVALIGYGIMTQTALEAADRLSEQGVACGVVDARFAKPLDGEFYANLARGVRLLVTLEEGALQGGFGSAVLEALSERGVSREVLRLGIPDTFVEHGERSQLLDLVGLSAAEVCSSVMGRLRR